MAEEPAADTLPDGIDRDIAERIAETFVQLYQSDQDDVKRYEATRHLLWQAMAAMVGRDVRDQAAVQTIVAALMEILVDGLGAEGAAEHMRRMADELEAGPPRLRQ